MSNRTSQLVPHVSSGAEKLAAVRRRRKKERNPAEKHGGTRLCCIRHVEECSLGTPPARRGRRRHLWLFIVTVIIIFIMIIVLRGRGSAARVRYTISPQPHPPAVRHVSPAAFTFSRRNAHDKQRSDDSPMRIPSPSPRRPPSLLPSLPPPPFSEEGTVEGGRLRLAGATSVLPFRQDLKR